MFDAFIIQRSIMHIEESLEHRRLQKIWESQPGLFYFKFSTTKWILIDLRAASYQISMLDHKPSDRNIQSQFLIALRNNLENGKIIQLEQLHFDRTIMMKFVGTNRIMESVHYFLYVELMGKHSNMILTDDQHQVINAHKLTPYRQESEHPVRVGETYRPMLSNRSHPKDCHELVGELEAYPLGFYKKLIKRLPEDYLQLPVSELYRKLLKQEGLYLYRKDGNYMDFHLFKSDEHENEFHQDFFEGVATFFDKQKDNLLHSDAKQESALIEHRLKQLSEKIAKLNAERDTYSHADLLRRQADAIYANLYQIETGQATLNTFDLETEKPLTITLNPRLSPSQNAQHYYERYQKAQRGVQHLEREIDKATGDLKLFSQLLYEAENATTEDEVISLREQMMDMGLMKHKVLKRKSKEVSPHHYVFENVSYYIGRNSKQNEKLTKHSPKDFPWLHAKDIPGSHVIIHKKLDELTEDQLIFGAKLAAYYSKAQQSSGVPVDYTLLKHVKKPSGGALGYFNYFHQKTLYVTPSWEEIKDYKK